MLDEARRALGQTFDGWKGGDFTMAGYTECWLAVHGCCGEGIGPVALTLLLASDQLDAVARARLSAFTQPKWRTRRG